MCDVCAECYWDVYCVVQSLLLCWEGVMNSVCVMCEVVICGNVWV